MLEDFERANYAIKWLCHANHRKQSDVASELGYKNASVLSQILTGKKPVPTNLANRIAALNPRINIDFLLGSSDQLLLDGPNPEVEPPVDITARSTKPKSVTIPPELATMFADMTATIKSQQELIANLINNQTK